MFGAVSIHLRGLIGQHNPRVSDQDLGVADPVPHGHTKEFLRTECLPVEINRGLGILEDKIRGDRAISVGNWLDHDKVLLPWTNVQCQEYRPSGLNESATWFPSRRPAKLQEPGQRIPHHEPLGSL